MGLEDMLKEGENAVSGQTSADQEYQNQQSGSGNDAKEDTVIDSVVDEFAGKEGLPAGADPELNNIVNEEVNKF